MDGFQSPRGGDFIETFIRNLKMNGGSIRFGITVYCDDLSMWKRARLTLAASIRANVDVVHLYARYRKDGDEVAQYVQRVKLLFPRAKVVGGIYAMDRIDYAGCSGRFTMKCRTDEEISLFANNLKLDLQMLRTGRLSAIEFYPGYFGNEDRLPSWKYPRFCASRREAECIENTKKMRRIAVDALTDSTLWKGVAER